MRKVKYIFLALTLFLCYCKKDNGIDFSQGKATALLNGVEWEAQTRAVYNTFYEENINLIFSSFNSNGEMRIQFGMANIDLDLGTTVILKNSVRDSFPGATLATLVSDGDAVDAHYLIDTTLSSNTISIDNIDLEKNKISGKFNIVFHVDTSISSSNLSNDEILRFTNGEFEAILEEK